MGWDEKKVVSPRSSFIQSQQSLLCHVGGRMKLLSWMTGIESGCQLKMLHSDDTSNPSVDFLFEHVTEHPRLLHTSCAPVISS